MRLREKVNMSPNKVVSKATFVRIERLKSEIAIIDEILRVATSPPVVSNPGDAW